MSSTDNSLPVNDLEDMAQRPNAKWITPRGTALESFIKVHFVFQMKSLIYNLQKYTSITFLKIFLD